MGLELGPRGSVFHLWGWVPVGSAGIHGDLQWVCIKCTGIRGRLRGSVGIRRDMQGYAGIRGESVGIHRDLRCSAGIRGRLHTI